jgi:hypothetical protein
MVILLNPGSSILGGKKQALGKASLLRPGKSFLETTLLERDP